MKRLRGKDKGQHLKPIQYANDWIMGEDADGKTHIVSPLAVQLDPEDRAVFTQPDNEAASVIQSGQFWRWYQLGEDGRFRKRPRG